LRTLAALALEASVAVAVIAVIALFFAGMGVYALAAPAALVRPFGITLGESTARSEVRAVYGGFGLAIAGVLALAAVRPDLRTGSCSRSRRRWPEWRAAASCPRSLMAEHRSTPIGSIGSSRWLAPPRCSPRLGGPKTTQRTVSSDLKTHTIAKA
jgi:hypothetical protein